MTNGRKITLFDNSRINTFKVCPRKFLLEHVYGWRPDEKSIALTFGSAWHAASDVVWRAASENLSDRSTIRSIVEEAHNAFILEWMKDGLAHPDELGPDELENLGARTPQVAKEMLHGYIEARKHIFSDPSFKLLAVELPFAVPLDPNDESLFYVGRLDKIFEYRKQVIVGEHKTSSSYKKGGPFRSDFVDSFDVSAQIDGYIYALRSQYRERAAGVWIDGALVHKTDHNGFMFIPQSRSDAQLDSWLWETHSYIDQIEGNKAALAERAHDDTDYLAAFPRNTSSCLQYGRCPMLDICRTTPNPAKLDGPPLGYNVNFWSPFSTIKLGQLGFTVDGCGEPVAAEQPKGDSQ